MRSYLSRVGAVGHLGRRYMHVDDRFFNFKVPPGYVQPEPDEDDEIVVSMSSGVDSSVSALMYSQRYKNVRGVFMANWSSSADGHVGAACSRDDGSKGSNSSCTVDRDWDEVQKTCQQLGIPCERVSFEKEYWLDVFEPMLSMYQMGLTPNPDVGCNRYVKFGSMLDHLERHLAPNVDNKWWMVTGHYAKVLQRQNDGQVQLFRADYRQKDQSYYLSQVPETALSHALLPLGHYTKPQVRAIAKEYGLATRDKPDSQGLCFVSPDVKFSTFLDEYLAPNPGDIVDRDGHVWGQHRGLWHATIGQRCGVSMPQGDPRYHGVWKVCDKDIERNRLVIARSDDSQAFLKSTVGASPWTWINGDLDLQAASDLNVQVRSLGDSYPVKTVQFTNDTLTVSLKEEIPAVAPGQDLVLYDGHRLLGSGSITLSE